MLYHPRSTSTVTKLLLLTPSRFSLLTLPSTFYQEFINQFLKYFFLFSSVIFFLVLFYSFFMIIIYIFAIFFLSFSLEIFCQLFHSGEDEDVRLKLKLNVALYCTTITKHKHILNFHSDYVVA